MYTINNEDDVNVVKMYTHTVCLKSRGKKSKRDNE